MKKTIFIFITLFISITSISATYKFYLGEKVPNMHIESVSDNDIHNGIPFILRRNDNNFVYCINPFEKINTIDSYTEYNYNNSIFNLTDEQIDKMNLIAYYGYNYDNHKDIKWYGITQFLIWKTLNLKDIYFTDTKDGNRIDIYTNEINEIENLVNDYYKLPSFNKHYDFSINQKYIIEDTNNIINNYEIKESNIDAEIKNNNLYISTTKEGIYEIKFIRKSPINVDYKLYHLNNYQALLLPGKVNDIKFNITIEVHSGSIKINKMDSENINRLEATLEGAIYGIYDEEELINTITTNENGIGYINNLPLGKYYVKEITASKGYKLDNNTYEINITKENKNIEIYSYEDVIKGNLIINKYYGEENNYIKEDNAVFELYNINNEKINTLETIDGIIEEKLEYGNYTLIQIKGIEGYKLVDKINLSITQNADYIFDLYNEREVLEVVVPDTYKCSYNIIISKILISIGSIMIIFYIFNKMKKTTE